MKKIYIIKAGTTFEPIVAKHGDFESWIARNIESFEVQIVDALQNEPPRPEACAGVIITGSHAMVTEELPWSVRLEEYIRELVDACVPLLGICYGHQLIAKSLGGTVDYHPGGMELGTVEVAATENAKTDALFKHLPQRFAVHTVHSQSVLALPEGATLLASNAFEPHHAFRIDPCVWAVQFHPEYDAAIMKAYIDQVLEASPDEAGVLAWQVREAPDANGIIALFADAIRTQSAAR